MYPHNFRHPGHHHEVLQIHDDASYANDDYLSDLFIASAHHRPYLPHLHYDYENPVNVIEKSFSSFSIGFD